MVDVASYNTASNGLVWLPGGSWPCLPEACRCRHAVAVGALLRAMQVSKLESEAEQLHADFMQSQQNVKALERRLAGMEAELVEQQQRVRTTNGICYCSTSALLQLCCMLAAYQA